MYFNRHQDPQINTKSVTRNIKNNFSNFDTSFTENVPLIDRPDFLNNNKVLHNNLNANLLSEQITNYYIYIDSRDRTIKVYPSPFKFTVQFGTVGQRSKYCCPGDDDEFQGTPNPIINRI